jgi:hypothetical protein
VNRQGSPSTLVNSFTYLWPGKSLGGGVFTPASGSPVSARTSKTVKASRTVDSARQMAVSVNQPIKLRMSGLPRKSKFKAQI